MLGTNLGMNPADVVCNRTCDNVHNDPMPFALWSIQHFYCIEQGIECYNVMNIGGIVD